MSNVQALSWTNGAEASPLPWEPRWGEVNRDRAEPIQANLIALRLLTSRLRARRASWQRATCRKCADGGAYACGRSNLPLPGADRPALTDPIRSVTNSPTHFRPDQPLD